MSPEKVIDYIKNGWELGSDTPEIKAGLPANEPWHIWLQQGGLCTGGKCLGVPEGTMELLLRKKIIEQAPRTENQDFWMARYRLASHGLGLFPIDDAEIKTLSTIMSPDDPA